MKSERAKSAIFNSLILMLGIPGMLLTASAIAQEWGTTDWVVECIDPTDCEPANEIYARQLTAASEWLSSLGFEEPISFNNLVLGESELRHWIANVSDAHVEQQGQDLAGIYEPVEELIWLRSGGYFTLGEPGQTHEDPWYMVRTASSVTSVHELFHAVQRAEKYHLPFADEWHWIKEGTATAVMLDYALEVEPDTEVRFPSRRYDAPLHKPPEEIDSYRTAGFWLYLGEKLQSTPRIAYLHNLLQEEKLVEGVGVAGVDAYLQPYGGLYKLFPLFVSELQFLTAFGEPSQWQARLPARQEQITKRFRGNVREIAGTAGQLAVSHASGKPVEIEIRFRGDHSDLHLIVDGAAQALGPDGDRNVFSRSLQNQSETFNIVVAGVAEDAVESSDRTFELEVTLQEDSGSWVELNGERYKIEPYICNSHGVISAPEPDRRSLLFTLRAPGGSNIVSWGGASVGATVFPNGCDNSYGMSCDSEPFWGAGGPPPANNPPALFDITMDYELETGRWTGSGIVQSQTVATGTMAFSIQCKTSSRKLIQ